MFDLRIDKFATLLTINGTKRNKNRQKPTSSAVKASSSIATQDEPSNDMAVIVPSISSGVSEHIKSAAEDTFLKVGSPSSYLEWAFAKMHSYKFKMQQCIYVQCDYLLKNQPYTTEIKCILTNNLLKQA